MIKPHGTGELRPLFVRDEGKRQALLEEAETLPAVIAELGGRGQRGDVGRRLFFTVARVI